MAALLRFCWFLAIFLTAHANTVSRSAVAFLTPRGPSAFPDISGRIVFTETSDGLHVSGTITGLSAGKYGFHVHELGDISTCDASESHFNPENTNHGGRNHTERHVGDLGNVVFVEAGASGTNGIANVDFTDHMLTLRGQNDILGRTLVLHEQEDDLGLGGDEASLATGNAGPRVACGVIGISFPKDPWNGGVTASPSLFLFIITTLASFMLFR